MPPDSGMYFRRGLELTLPWHKPRYMWLLSRPVTIGLFAKVLILLGSLGSAEDLTQAQAGGALCATQGWRL